jgi:hypothetical protein
MAPEQQPDPDFDASEIEDPSDAPPNEAEEGEDEEIDAEDDPSNPTNSPLKPIGDQV